MKSRKTCSRLLLVASALGITLVLAACGGSGSDSSANNVDRAFVAQMIPHHMLAVDMAEVAAEEAQRPEIQQLAADIISTQNAEIETMQGIRDEIGQSDSEHSMDGMSDETMEGMSGEGNTAADAQALGLSVDAMGMSMSANELNGARPFEREFIDMMVPHHTGAIAMARAELRGGDNSELRAIARGIIKAQTAEIKEMDRWRAMWYGTASGGGLGDGSPTSDGGQMPMGN